MSEDFGLEKYLDAKFSEVQGSISGIHERLDTLNGRTRKIENEQAETRGSLATWKWIAGSGGLIGVVTFAIVMLR